tara:strand:+ start:28 stop:282 length:255 start_codon:yes stop_codon:yes gene_type:complete
MGLVGVQPVTTIATISEQNKIFEGLKLIGLILMFVRKKTLRGSQQATNTLLANYFGLPSNPPVLSFDDTAAQKAQLNHLGTNSK